MAGFTVLTADSSEQAREVCLAVGMDKLSAVLSDYRLPGDNGMDLLNWIRALDSTLSTVIITGQGEKAIVQQAISSGAFHYVEKPVTHQIIRKVLRGAIDNTHRQRQFASDREGLQAIQELDNSLNVVIPEEFRSRTTIYYKPLHDVGGDFLITHDAGGGHWVLLVGDISGHDIRSSFVSTYFQGLFRGCLESGGNTETALKLFNSSLRQQRMQKGDDSALISLSVSTIEFCPASNAIRHWNFGFTPCYVVTDLGRIIECPFGQFPLGWVKDLDAEPTVLQVNGNGLAYIFTDGFVDLANNLELNFFSLLYRSMRQFIATDSLPEQPSDDILVIRYQLNPLRPLSHTFEPILSEHYAGTEVEHIDHLQANWRRSVAFALDHRLGDRIYDLLICIREGMLNALIHGCDRSPDKFAHLQISFNDGSGILRVHIDDPGHGHNFDLQKRIKTLENKKGEHLGLGIIYNLSDELRIENNGTSLIFDFKIEERP